MNINTTLIPESIHLYFPVNVVIDWDLSEKVALALKGSYTRVVIVYQEKELIKEIHLENLQKSLKEHGIQSILYNEFRDKPIPNFEEIDSLSYFLKKSKAELVIAFGGRNTLIATRNAALLTTNNLFAEELYTESKTPHSPPLPFINIPLGAHHRGRVFFLLVVV